MRVQTALILSSLLLATAVHAEGPYVMASVGQSSFKDSGTQSDLNSTLTNAGIPVRSSSMDKEDFGYKIQFGYQFDEYFAVEGGYTDLGKMSYHANVAGGTVGSDISAAGVNVSGIVSYPITNEFSIIGVLGLIDAEVTAKVHASGAAGSASDSTSSTDVKTHFGFGAEYAFNNAFSTRLEYERYDNLGNSSTTGEGDVDLFSLGLIYSF